MQEEKGDRVVMLEMVCVEEGVVVELEMVNVEEGVVVELGETWEEVEREGMVDNNHHSKVDIPVSVRLRYPYLQLMVVKMVVPKRIQYKDA